MFGYVGLLYICFTKPHHMKNFLRSMRMILARKLTPLKSVGLAFRKDKGDFKSGSKENNSCARDGAGAGCLDKRNSNTLVSLGIFGGFA